MVFAYVLRKNAGENIYTLYNTNFLGVYDIFISFCCFFYILMLLLLFSVAEILDEALFCGSNSGFFIV
jgi:hypothetical protein